MHGRTPCGRGDLASGGSPTAAYALLREAKLDDGGLNERRLADRRVRQLDMKPVEPQLADLFQEPPRPRALPLEDDLDGAVLRDPLGQLPKPEHPGGCGRSALAAERAKVPDGIARRCREGGRDLEALAGLAPRVAEDASGIHTRREH